MNKKLMTEEEWYKKLTKDATLFGVTWDRIKELFTLFAMDGYEVTDDEQWKDIKRKYFKKV